MKKARANSGLLCLVVFQALDDLASMGFRPVRGVLGKPFAGDGLEAIG
jgi:hypothetical protein